MRGTLRFIGWLTAGLAIVAVLIFALPSARFDEVVAPPAEQWPPHPPPPPGEALEPESPGSEPFAPTGDPAADWARIRASGAARDFEIFARAYPDSPLAAEASTRGLNSIPAAARPGGEPSGGGPVDAALRAQFSRADIAFNAPKRLGLRQTARVELALSPKSAGVAPASRLAEGLPGKVVTVEGVDYALRMQATLSGQDFAIDPEGAVARTVLADRATTWDWTVKPLTHGPDKPLTLRLEAVVSQDGRDLPPVEIETFATTILVEVTFWDRVVEMAGEIRTVHAALIAVGGSVAAAMAWLWARRRKPPAEPPPQQVEIIHRFAQDGDADRAAPKDEPPIRRTGG